MTIKLAGGYTATHDRNLVYSVSDEKGAHAFSFVIPRDPFELLDQVARLYQLALVRGFNDGFDKRTAADALLRRASGPPTS